MTIYGTSILTFVPDIRSDENAHLKTANSLNVIVTHFGTYAPHETIFTSEEGYYDLFVM